MKIGCISLVFHPISKLIVAINCAKGRGYILPGGKMNSGETFKETAARELYEETGLRSSTQKLIFQAPSGADEYYVLTFLTTVFRFDSRDSEEGTVDLVNWGLLLQSKFKGYYELLYDHIRAN